MKIAYNRCYGGFSLSHKAIMRYAELKGIKLYAFRHKDDSNLRSKMVPISDEEAEEAFLVHYCTTPEYSDAGYWYKGRMEEDRSDPALIQVIEEMGKEANGSCAELAITEVPARTLWRIDEYDGRESIEISSDVKWNVAS